MANRLPHTVSGLSAGGYMAVQHHIAYSNDVDAVGVVAGGPFWCANANAIVAQTACMKTPALISVAELLTITHTTAATGFIDPVRNVVGQRVWLFSGTLDTEVAPGVAVKLRDYYLGLGVRSDDLRAVFNMSAEHAMPTLDYGNACDFLGPPYISRCGYDAAGEMLSFLLSAPGAAPLLPPKPAVNASLIAFDQSPFAPLVGLEAAALAGLGYAYVPASCEQQRRALLSGAGAGAAVDRSSVGASWNASCRVHVAYHGCHQGEETINTTYVRHAGYNRWAEANRLVILYPQARKTLLNPKGCWDWWGYTGPEYASNLGLQLKAVRRMVEAMAGGGG